ncbi:hypothetical protein A3762_00525 [Oleiphilus sp. HI0125]|uniref:flagellar hook-length control protein FliK n=1 Tax=Oleiphilus sp. HI0125 TaxID=1822266 RepID=UPI0007C3D366|nr:flagellar hook-length control protein FliK [Oleiphilus sp. HI0125]KZZ59499.1 hypothetical protein A3762_00525 [Oleiphilus sp. HI0125]
MEIPFGSSPEQNKAASTEQRAPISSTSQIIQITGDTPLQSLPVIRDNIVEIQSVDVKKNQTALIQIIGKVKGEILSTDQAITIGSKGNRPTPLPTQASELRVPHLITSPAQPISEKELSTWLIQIKNQFILASSKLALKTGMVLNLTLTEAGTPVIKNLPAEQIATLPLQTKNSSPEAQLSQLRSSLARLLPQQVSLNSGFKILQQTQISPAMSDRLEGAQQASSLILNTLKEQLPKSADLTAKSVTIASTSTEQVSFTPIETIKSWLKLSGIELEAKLLNRDSKQSVASQNTPDQVKTLDIQGIWKTLTLLEGRSKSEQDLWQRASQRAINIINLNGPMLTPPEPLQTRVSEFIQQLPTQLKSHTSMSATAQKITDFDQLSNSLFNQTKQLFDLLSSNTANTLNANKNNIKLVLTNLESIDKKAPSIILNLANHQHSPAFKLLSKQNELFTQQIQNTLNLLPNISKTQSDIKASLQSLAFGISQSSNTPKPSTSQTENLSSEPRLYGLSENQLFTKAFDFPKLDNSTLKAQAILADQELSTGQLLRLLAGMINRIQFNQVNSLYQAQTSNEPGFIQAWNIELPYTHQSNIETLQLRIEQHEQKQEQHQHPHKNKEKAWIIKLQFNLEGIGPLHVRATLNPPHVKTEFWAKNQKSLQLIKSEENLFKAQLKKADLNIDSASYYLGAPPSDTHTEVKQGFVDTRA